MGLDPLCWKGRGHHVDPVHATAGRYRAVRPVGSKGDSYDNAAAAAVNSFYKKELINQEGPGKTSAR